MNTPADFYRTVVYRSFDQKHAFGQVIASQASITLSGIREQLWVYFLLF